MGGGGSYYDRDVTEPRLTRSKKGYSAVSQKALERNDADAAVLPKNRRLASICKSPIVYAFDVTGSMGSLPKIIYDKMPMMAGELSIKEYLRDVEISLAAIGDVTSDNRPIQIADFSPVRNLDKWLQKIYLEGNGGGQHYESYEFIAYYYARLFDIKNAETPIFLFTADEAFRKDIYARDLQEQFGGEHKDIDSRTIFSELKKKFKGNVFLLHRTYDDEALNTRILAQWEETLGKENIIHLSSDKSIADTTLGILAIASGSRTLDEYVNDIRNRPLDLGGVKFEPQSEERIAEVKQALLNFAAAHPKNAAATPENKENWQL